MPMYLVHGFRWPRTAIRIHIILKNLDDAAAEYIIAPGSAEVLVQSFRDTWPDIMEKLGSNIKLMEQYDEKDESEKAVTQPYAFVADQMLDCQLSADVSEVIKKIEPTLGEEEGESALAKLRDQLCPDAKISWFVVYNGDLERDFDPKGPAEAANGHEEYIEPVRKEIEKVKVTGSIRKIFRKREA